MLCYECNNRMILLLLHKKCTRTVTGLIGTVLPIVAVEVGKSFIFLISIGSLKIHFSKR